MYSHWKRFILRNKDNSQQKSAIGADKLQRLRFSLGLFPYEQSLYHKAYMQLMVNRMDKRK